MNQPILPNELRVGNVLMYTGSEQGPMRCKIDAQDILFCEDRNEEFNRIHQRITLTPELLVEVGFTSDQHKISYYHPAPKEPENEHKDLGTSYPTFFFNNRLERWMDCHTRVCVDYFHQLQNLYFALTGEELKINTK